MDAPGLAGLLGTLGALEFALLLGLGNDLFPARGELEQFRGDCGIPQMQ